MIDQKVNQLIDQLAERERRTRSAVVEVAMLAYAKNRSDIHEN
jgi:hypothetical protein